MAQNNSQSVELSYHNETPPVSSFIQFRADCGWGTISELQAKRALDNALFSVTVFAGQKVVGSGRVIGDGALNYYIQDLIVDPAFRNQQVGSKILSRLMAQIKEYKLPGSATVGLMSAAGKEAFYEQFGFTARPTDVFGAGMTMDLD